MFALQPIDRYASGQVRRATLERASIFSLCRRDHWGVTLAQTPQRRRRVSLWLRNKWQKPQRPECLLPLQIPVTCIRNSIGIKRDPIATIVLAYHCRY